MAQTKADEHFLKKLDSAICKNIEDTPIDVEKNAKAMNRSRIALYRKIKAISVLIPPEVITLPRLKKTANYWPKEPIKYYQIANREDLSSQRNFTKSFQKQIGVAPTDYLHSKQKQAQIIRSYLRV